MTITEVSQKFNIPQDTLRYYERVGLLPRVNRNKSGIRNYTEENWQTNKQAIFGGLPPVICDVVAAITRRKFKAQIIGHGIGRLTHEELFELGKEDIDSLANFLGDKPYFMGDKPTSLDASAYGILVNALGCPIKSPLKDHALTKQNLMDYCRRMQAEFFPELSWEG